MLTLLRDLRNLSPYFLAIGCLPFPRPVWAPIPRSSGQRSALLTVVEASHTSRA